jgi:hypothetical protein
VDTLEQVFDAYLADLETTHDLDCWLDSLMRYCEQTKESAAEGWPEIVRRSRLHQLFQVIQECPYHRRAFEKPRGYPGDAVMLDMIYELEGGIEESARLFVTKRGLQLFHAYQRRDSCESVRERKRELARQIHRAADSKRSTQILAIACGHLREVMEVEREAWSNVSELIAFDQDTLSLAVVADECAHLPIKPLQGRVQDVIKGSIRFADFDFIYSAGLFDYLDDKSAIALTQRIAAALGEGASALIGNFQSRPEMAYAEIFQDWKLVARSDQDLMRLGSVSLGANRFKWRVRSDPWKSIAWLEIDRATQ